MLDIRPSTIVEDSRGNRCFFYYKDYSIYYREVTNTGEIKDTILISQVGSDFAAAIDAEDTLYLVCNSRYKGILLFIYTNYGWKFEYVITVHNSSNIYLMDMLAFNGSIHIFFSKKLPLPNIYNIYHISRDLNDPSPYAEYAWRKNILSEIYSQNIEQSYSIIQVKGGLIYFAGIWHDGTNHYINYCCYDDGTKSWIHKSLPASYKNGVNIRLIYHNKKVNLFCFSEVGDGNNLHHFTNKPYGSGEIEFKHLYSTKIEAQGTTPSFYADEKAIRMEWIKDRVYFQYIFDEASGKWKKSIELPQTADADMLYLRVIKNTGSALHSSKGFYLLDMGYNFAKPLEHSVKSGKAEKSAEKPANDVPSEAADYLKEILNEIKSLSDSIKYLNKRLDSLEGNRELPALPALPAPLSNKTPENPVLKKSNFKEKFMKSTSSPDYKNLFLKQEGISAFAGKPAEDRGKPGEIAKESKPAADASKNEKQAFVKPPIKSDKSDVGKNDIENPEDYKYNNIFKKIGEFFK